MLAPSSPSPWRDVGGGHRTSLHTQWVAVLAWRMERRCPPSLNLSSSLSLGEAVVTGLALHCQGTGPPQQSPPAPAHPGPHMPRKCMGGPGIQEALLFEVLEPASKPPKAEMLPLAFVLLVTLQTQITIHCLAENGQRFAACSHFEHQPPSEAKEAGVLEPLECTQKPSTLLSCGNGTNSH